jgi:hypothetical protein
MYLQLTGVVVELDSSRPVSAHAPELAPLVLGPVASGPRSSTWG